MTNRGPPVVSGPMATANNDQVRVNFRIKGPFLDHVHDVMDLCGLGNETEAVRYLAQRGLEALSGQLQTRRLMRRMEGQYAPQELLPLMKAMEDEGIEGLPHER